MRRLALLIFTCAFLVIPTAGCGGGGGSGSDAGLPELPDEDGDNIADVHEGRAEAIDTDGDGTPDYLDTDSDGDGVPDYREGGDDTTRTPPVDSDGDGTEDFRDTDSDNNGREDGVDGADDIDGDGRGNFADPDDDGDGLLDVDELGANPAMPVDSDMDGTPDFQDIDSDNDTIGDRHEGMRDVDNDGKPAYLDDDSDADCILDSIEAGDADVNTPPVDTDGDLQFDFVDLDSDGDGLLDSIEDANCNGTRDGTETDRIKADTDGDGVSDLIEDAAGTDPNNDADSPLINGDFVFIVPYNGAPSPTEDALDFSTDVGQADVLFTMDETVSMDAEIANLKLSMSSLIATVRTQLPDTAFGVVGYRDFPTAPYGSPGDEPFVLRHRIMTATTSAGLASVQGAVDQYSAAGGNDGPEAGWEMMYQIATGVGTTEGGASVPPFTTTTAPPVTVPAGEETGTIGGVGFRAGSLPVVVWITDTCSHNSPQGESDYTFASVTRDAAVTALQEKSIRVIALISGAGCGNNFARLDAQYGVEATGAVVPVSAWGAVGVRPSDCTEIQCCTGLGGAGELSPDGMCPLIFRVNGSTGAGLTDAMATAIRVVTRFGALVIGATAKDDPSDSVDALDAFVQRVEANTVAGAPCESAGLVAIDTNGDTIKDTFSNVNAGTTVCFDVVPKMNTTVPATDVPQMFKASVTVSGDGITVLDTRRVFFLVPPEIPDIPVD